MTLSSTKERLGMLFILVGPGGVGKNALLNNVTHEIDDLNQLPTATTRPIRPGEAQGREHLFISLSDFEEMIENDQLLEHQEVHPGKFYGVPRATVDDAITERRDLIADIEIFGAQIIRAEYPHNSRSVFIAPPNTEELVERLKTRQASAEDIQDRMNRLPMEMRYMPLCDYVVVNDNMDAASTELLAILRYERGERDKTGFPLHEISYHVEVIPAHQGDVLCRIQMDDLFPGRDMPHGHDPNTFALDLITGSLSLTADSERLAPRIPDGSVAVTCYNDPQSKHYRVNYTYTYELPERIAAPPGWRWTTYDQVRR